MSKEMKIIGYQYADGVHWHWIDNGTDTEVAVINDRGEIEWCVRTYNLPEEVVAEIRNKVPRPSGTWLIEARRVRHSVTQGTINIFVNGKDMDMCFNDEMKLNENGEYESTTPDSEIGKCVYACLWHKLDDVYHYSERFKDVFYPNWRNS